MLCKKPYMLGVLACGCGQCLPCRINRRRLWTSRMVLESAKHAGNCFVTLTYNEITLPYGSTLRAKDATNWVKRLRQTIYPKKIRYFIVGEYGEKTNRPHYHAAIFGLDQSLGGGLDGRRGLVATTWGNGHTYTGDLSKESAGYICGYVTKKMTSKEDPRLEGRYPEFARMSLKPGIGADAMKDVAYSLGDELTMEYLQRTGDVPGTLKFGSKQVNIGRYLKSKLKQELGYGKKPTEEALKIYSQKMRDLFESERYAAKIENRQIHNLPEMMAGKIKSIEARYKINASKQIQSI